MKIQLSDHFTYKKLIKFTMPSIAMMIFTSIYGVVDGFFVSNFVGKTPFAALNFIMPFIMILGTVGFMFGSGGSALVSKTMGEGDMPRAKDLFSLFIYFPTLISMLISVIGIIFLPQVCVLLGADSELIYYSVLYGRILLIGMPLFTLQMEFQTFFVTAERPNIGFIITIVSGVVNMILDALFVGIFHWGIAGAAAASVTSQAVGAIAPVIYFLRPNTSKLRLGKTNFDGKAIVKAATNGFSELLSGISMSLVGMLYNVQLMKYAGENGIAAYGIMMYVDMIFTGTFIGYSFGSAPVVSFHYGAENHKELKSLLKKSLILMGIASVAMFVFAEAMARPLSHIFSSYDVSLMDMTAHGFSIYSFSFLVVSIAIYGSSFFTALNNGLISAAISFLRTVVFEVVAILFLPKLFGIDGIWYSIVFARIMSAVITIFFLIKNKYRYHYN